MVRPTITSEKHIVQRSLLAITGGTSATENIAVALADPGVSGRDVKIGTTIKACFVEMWMQGSTTQLSTVIAIVEKTTNGAGGAQFANMTAMHSYVNKKNIFYTTQGLVGDSNTNPTPFLRQWIKIPKGKQRFGLGDALRFTIAIQTTDDVEQCGIFIYKAYT